MKQKHLLLCLLIASALFSCKKNKKQTPSSNLWEFRDYVSSFTHGVISKQNPIEIEFSQEIPTYSIDDKLPNSVLSISPAVQGEVKLINPYTIQFIPKNVFKSDQNFHVEVKMKKLFPDIKIKKPFQFDFKTIKPNFSVLLDELQSSPSDGQVLNGHIETADIMSFKEVDKLLTATQNGKRLPVQIENEDDGKYFNFSVQGLERFDEESEVNIKWDGRPVGINITGSQVFKLPNNKEMIVLRMDVNNNDQQVLNINFSDEIDRNQNFNGLIQIDSIENMTFSTNGNILSVYPGSSLSGEYAVNIFEGIRSVDGKTARPTVEQIYFDSAKPEVRFIGSGSILPNSQGLKLNFEAISLYAVDVRVIKIFQNNILHFLQSNNLGGSSNIKRVGRPVASQRIVFSNSSSTNKWKAYSVDLAPLIGNDIGSIYRVELSFKPEYSAYNCGQSKPELKNEVLVFDSNDAYWNNESYYDNYWSWSNYNWRERNNPCHDAYYNENRSIATNLLASDLGLVAKRNDNNRITVFAQNLITTKPQSSAEIKFYNYQLQVLSTSGTNSNGRAEYSGSDKVAFIEANYDGHRAFLKLDDGAALMTSQFAVDGYEAQKGMKGYIYGERGIWRPGDNIYLNFILNDVDNPIPENHPVKFKLTNPEGLVVDEQMKNDGLNGFYNFNTKTNSSARTGNYLATVTVGGAVFTRSIPVENIKPNRLKIDFKPKTNSATLDSKWLHGAIAANLKATVDAKIKPTKTYFEKFPSYDFDDDAVEFKQEENRIFEGFLDGNGHAELPLQFENMDHAPGKLNITYITKVYEKGGNFSIDAMTDEYSPYSSYVGILSPQTEGYYKQLDTDKPQSFQVATVDEEGKPMAINGLQVDIYKVDFRWWWDESDENLASYISSKKMNPEYSKTVNTNSSGKATFSFQVDYPEWGRYLVRIKNPQSGHYTSTTVYYDWPSWRGRSQKSGSDAANILSFTTDKEEYKVGETIEVNFPSSKSGRALISVENGVKVLEVFWVDPSEDFTTVKIKASKQMAPNVYINISYIQPHAQTENDLPIRLYGIVPVSVYDEQTKLEPVIKVDKKLRPESDYNVVVKEKSGKSMTYTLAVVDEGLLDLTRFKTPNAWDDFFKKQALGVRTWDMYDDVIGAYAGRVDQIFSIGGGDMAEAAGAKKAQRFKPVVTYLGPFELTANSKKTHQLTMPNYVGSVRVMVVAANVQQNAYGSAEETTEVKKPLMVLGTMPRKVSPGEQITMPVSVFAMENKVKNVTVSVSTNSLLQLTSPNSQSLYFNEPGEQEAYFTIQVPEETGIANLTVEATGGGEKSTYSVELDVINPNTAENRVQKYELHGNESKLLQVEPFGVIGSNTSTVQISTLPYGDFSNRLNYLIQYPHGCAEQVTSAGFPQLYLDDISELNAQQKTEVKKNVKKAIDRLRNYQASNGGIQYWPASGEANEFATNYVGHFLIEAKNKGYEIPFGMLENLIQFQQSKSRSNASYSSWNSFNQAYRLYTLALAGSPDLSAMNRLRERKGLDVSTRWRLAAAYAIAGQQQNAKKIINLLKDDLSSTERYQVYGSALRNEAMALETSILLEIDDLSTKLATSISKQLDQDEWYSTQTVSYSLLALSKYINKRGGKTINAELVINGESIPVQSEKPISVIPISLSEGQINSVSLNNNSDGQLFVSLNQNGVPEIGAEQAESRQLSLLINYTDLGGKPIDVKTLPQATEFVATITIKNLDRSRIENVAFTQQIPSGWEIINTRYTDESGKRPSNADYIDIKDDRVYYYFDLKSNEEKQFKLLLNASFTGDYYLPGSLAEAMYNHDYYAKKSGTWIKVVE